MTDADLKKLAVQKIIQEMMNRVMNRVLFSDPFIPEKHHNFKPMYAALVPDEIFKASHFERRFVTIFGSVWEQLAIETAKSSSKVASNNYHVAGMINSERLRRIQVVLNRLEHQNSRQERQKPDWQSELSYILEGTGEDFPVTVVCDVFFEDPLDGKRCSFELKSPLPNSDITKVSKEKILKLYAMHPQQVDEAFFALPYNPYGKKSEYGWSFPERWFNMKMDPVVLIGEEFWDKVGGIGTYKALVEATNELGMDYKEQIYREFLGTEPPEDTFTLT